MLDFGTVKPGTTLYIPWNTFSSDDPSASMTITGLATTDIEIYKNGSTTQRSSDSGYALLDTDGIDFDSVTGIHGISINLADNTDAGFYASGAQYWVVIASITLDAGTINFVAATFRIGYPDALLDTTIASLSTQTSFTLTAGPAEDNALNGMYCIIHDIASAVQMGYAVISDYTGATKTVTLAAGTTFTAAAGDNISIMGPMPLQPATSGRTLGVESDGDLTKVNTLDGHTAQTGDTYALANGAAGFVAIDTVVDAIKAVTDNLPDSGALSSLATATALATVDTVVDAIMAVTDNLPDSGALSSLATAAALTTVDTVVDAIKAVTDNLPDSGALSSLATAAALTTVDTVVDAIKAKTDNLPSGVSKNVALSNFTFYMTDSDDHVSAKTGLTVTAEISKNGGAFSACTNSVTEISSGLYKIDYTQTEMNADIVTLKFTATGADQRVIIITTT